MKKIIKLPVRAGELSELNAGDLFYLSGTLATGRDAVYGRIVDDGLNCPFDLSFGAIYHTGPIVKESQNGAFELVSIGPTSSIRMEKWSASFLEKTGAKIMIGKGSMGAGTENACRTFGAIHCVYPGGCAVLGAEQIEKIETVFWHELGMAECMWILKAREFGPLIVSIDTKGNNIFSKCSIHP
jgi:L(+)-tartrate dehydratase beta subunit